MNENSKLNRRHLLQGAVGASITGWTLNGICRDDATPGGGNLHLAPFRFDVTPPIGHSCGGGWMTPVFAIDDTLEAIGFVLLGAGKPIVICAVDWTGLLNEAHVDWRQALAEAAGTTPDRVAIQCVHQHNAPLACLEASRIVSEHGDLPHIVEFDYFRRCLAEGRRAVADAIKKAEPLTHVAHGQAKIDKVASNRRIFRDENGRVQAIRGSSCRDPQLQAMPEGLIDPWMKTVSFYNGNRKVASCHYYATHPTSYYGDGRVTSDFAGLARKQRQQDEPDCFHLYFTGCAGNIAAGKYNDGLQKARSILTQRVYEGIVASERDLQPIPIEQVRWNAVELLPEPRKILSPASLIQQIEDNVGAAIDRNRAAFTLSWLRRLERKIPLVLSSLRLNDASLLHLPAECFVEYQLRAQQFGGEGFVATAAYGDGGPWHIPVKEEYPNGGYEVSFAFSDPSIDDALTAGMRGLLD